MVHFAAIAAGAQPNGQEKLDRDLLGSWEVVSAEMIFHEKKADTKSLENARVSFGENKHTSLKTAVSSADGTYEIYPSMNPKGIDLTFPDDDTKKPVTIQGIYLITKEELKLSLTLDDSHSRPKEFKIVPELPNQLLLVLKRTKSAPPPSCAVRR
jgi:uncharacterized protein (TIGR03067 family)